MKVLILGGYGVFGGRLAEMLSDIGGLELLICGRNLERAKAFCKAYQGEAKAIPFQLDRINIAQALWSEKPHIVVDASGPFQDYGDSRYYVIEHCIDAGVNYLDLADAADFVFGVSKLDEEAKNAEVFALSGVSSFPVLTSAVLRKMSKNMEVLSVTGGVAPSPYAGIGLNVMRAILSYAGTNIKLHRDGKPAEATGLGESKRYTIAVPGKIPLRNIHFSLVDVPDLQIIPAEYEDLQDIWMGAGPVPEILHRCLNVAAKIRARFGLPSMAPFAKLFHKVLSTLNFGEHRGGMFVEARGLRDGKAFTQSWHLLAEGDDGPYIPSMAVEAIIRKCVEGESPAVGAGAADLELEDYGRSFNARSIYTGFRSEISQDQPIYRQALGPAFEDLPPKVKAIHDSTQTRRWAGTAKVERGTGVLARMIGKIIGFPDAADIVPVHVTMACENGGELWTRNFDGRTFSSFQEMGTKRNQHLVVESFGMISVALALLVEDDRLYLVPRRWAFLGMPLPKFMLPKGSSFETEHKGKFCFDVEISAPIVGLIVAYKGQLIEQ